jgi:hypothetical protein
METRNKKMLRLFKNGKSYRELSRVFNISKTRVRQIMYRQIEIDILRQFNFIYNDLSEEEKELLFFAVNEEITEIIKERNLL